MRKLFSCLTLLIVAGAYLHYVQGWDWSRVRRARPVTFVLGPQDSGTTTPVGQRGTGTRWETASPMPFARSAFGAAVIGNTIYVVGGIDGYFRTLSSVVAYDIGPDAWRALPRLPQAVHHPAVATDGEKLYVVGGLTGLASRPIDDVYVFDPAKGAWEQIGRLNDFRGAAAAAWLDGRLYAMGGFSTAGPDDAFEYLDAERGVWNGLQSMPTARGFLSAAALDGKIYAVGGRKGSLARNLGVNEAYDPKAAAWERLPEMTVARSSHAVAASGGRLYAFGGETKDGTIAVVESYDPTKKAWTRSGLPMPKPRQGLAAVPWKDRIYVIGGGRRPGFSVSDLNEVLILADAK